MMLIVVGRLLLLMAAGCGWSFFGVACCCSLLWFIWWLIVALGIPGLCSLLTAVACYAYVVSLGVVVGCCVLLDGCGLLIAVVCRGLPSFVVICRVLSVLVYGLLRAAQLLRL